MSLQKTKQKDKEGQELWSSGGKQVQILKGGFVCFVCRVRTVVTNTFHLFYISKLEYSNIKSEPKKLKMVSFKPNYVIKYNFCITQKVKIIAIY